MIDNNSNQENSSLLAEIFLKPSNLSKSERFTQSDASACSGRCASGQCNGVAI